MSSNFLNEIEDCIKNNSLFAFYYTCSNEDTECIFMYPISIKNNTLFGLDTTKENTVSYLIINMHPFTDFTSNAWDKYSQCQGCRYGLGNQQGHYGGCIVEPEY